MKPVQDDKRRGFLIGLVGANRGQILCRWSNVGHERPVSPIHPLHLEAAEVDHLANFFLKFWVFLDQID